MAALVTSTYPTITSTVLRHVKLIKDGDEELYIDTVYIGRNDYHDRAYGKAHNITAYHITIVKNTV